MISQKQTYISDVAYRDSVFIAKVSFEHFENKDIDGKITLKIGRRPMRKSDQDNGYPSSPLFFIFIKMA